VTTIAIDGLNEEEFRRSIEGRLRRGQIDEAIERLRVLLRPYAGPGRILPERFLTVCAADFALVGWDQLGDRVRRHDRPGKLITALQIAFGWPGEDVPQPDAEGRLHPLIEVGYYNDDAFPFSASARDDLLDGYSFYGCSWADDSQASDNALSLVGIDDLHGALAELEARLLVSEEPDEEEIRAGSLGACLLSVLLFQAVKDMIASAGLPRPLCVMAGSNGVYPYFDAPVVGMPENVRLAAGGEVELGPEHAVPGPRYSSLLVTGIPRAQKRAVLVLEESEEEMGVRIAKLRGLAHGDGSGEPAKQDVPAKAAIFPVPGGPLLVKKHPTHKHSDSADWDFRDMLGPRDPDAPRPSIDLGPGPDDDDWDGFEPLGPKPPEERGLPIEMVEPLPQPEPDFEAPEPVLPETALFDRLREAFPPPPPEHPVEFEQAEQPPSEPEPEPEPEPEFRIRSWPEPWPGPKPEAGERQVPATEKGIEDPLAAEPEITALGDGSETIADAPDWWFEERLAAAQDLPEPIGTQTEAAPEPVCDQAIEDPAPPTWASGLAWRERGRASLPVPAEPILPAAGRKRQVGVVAQAPGLWQRLRAWFTGRR
jgi:hypothetical protein